MKKKAQYPLEGIYYFIPDKNSWDIMIDTPEGIDTQHDEFWENSVVPELVSRYHLSTKQSDNLKLVPLRTSSRAGPISWWAWISRCWMDCLAWGGHTCWWTK